MQEPLESDTSNHLNTDPESSTTIPIRPHVAFVPSIQDHRERVAKVRSKLSPAKRVAHVDMVVPLSKDDVKIPVRIYLPKKAMTQPLPTVFYFPGTGFVANENSCTYAICSHLCEKAECQVIEVRSRLAPENPFPIGLSDAYEVFTYFATEWHQYYHIDREKIAIAGYSSGGNFAALVAIEAMKNNIFIRRQILISPMVDLSRSLKRFKAAEDKDQAISENFLRWIIALYAPEDISLKSPAMSPFWQSDKTLQRLPPTDILIGEWDRTRSDAHGYYEKLKKNAVDTELLIAPEQDHGCLWNNIEITHKIAERLTVAFKSDTLDTQHRLYYIACKPEEEEELVSKKNTSLTAKL